MNEKGEGMREESIIERRALPWVAAIISLFCNLSKLALWVF